MLPKEKGKRELKCYKIWYLKAEKECKRNNERGNEQVRKKQKYRFQLNEKQIYVI